MGDQYIVDSWSQDHDVLVTGTRDKHGGTAWIGTSGAHCAEKRRVALLQELRLLGQSAVFSAFTLWLDSDVTESEGGGVCPIRLREISEGHTLLNDGGIGGLPRITLDQPQAQSFLPGRLGHNDRSVGTMPEGEKRLRRSWQGQDDGPRRAKPLSDSKWAAADARNLRSSVWGAEAPVSSQSCGYGGYVHISYTRPSLPSPKVFSFSSTSLHNGPRSTQGTPLIKVVARRQV